MDSKIKNKCPNCSKYYCLQVYQGKTYIPLQLPCGHTMCHNCIKNKVKFYELLECKVCNTEINLSVSDRQMIKSKQDNVFERFTIDYYLYGQLSAALIFGNKTTDVHNKYSQDYYINVKALMSDSNIVANCEECNDTTNKKCAQCDILLCDTCFVKIHSYVQSFKHHTCKSIDPVFQSNICPLHTDKTCDYYCKDCDMAKCIDCTIFSSEKSCKNHDCIPFREKNVEMASELMALAPVLDISLRRLSATAIQNAHLLKKLDQCEDSKINDLITNAENYFSKLHYTVQKTENKVMCALESIKKTEIQSLLHSRKDIATNFQTIRNVLNLMDNIMQGDTIKKVNVMKILETAKNAINLPWFLLENQNNNDLSLEVNEDVFKSIEDFIKLKGNIGESYKLLSTNDIPAGITIPRTPDSIIFPPEFVRDVRENTIKQKPNSPNATPSTQLHNYCKKFVPGSYKKVDNTDQLSTCSSKSTDSNKTIQDDNMKPLINGSKEMVFLSHIEDPHNFYAQRVRQQKLLKDMNKEFQNASNLPKLTKDHINFGQIYLGYTEVHNQWQRCRLEKNCYDEKDTTIFELFFIDYGVTEFVTIDKLRHIPIKRLSNPPMLAIHCKLANCEPIQSTWKPDDAILMHKIINNKKAMLFIRSDKQAPSNKYLCDVVTYEDDTSLAHALVFHERARLINPKIITPTIFPYDEKIKIYSSVNDLSSNTTHEVFITHVVSPDKFYVRKSYLMSTYKKLCQDMNKAYKGTYSTVHCPTEDMVYAVDVSKYSKVQDQDGPWRRAVVRALLGEQRVTVYLADTGEVYNVHHTALRRIQQQFLKYKALAIECHLSCLTTTKKLWNHEAISLLESYRDTLLHLEVEKNVRDRDSTSVVLHFVSDECDTSVCINNELIKKHFAIAIGMPIFTKICRAISREESTHMEAAVKQNCKNQNKNSKNKIKILTKNNDDEKNLKPMDKGPIKLEVRILSCPSPSLIYVSLVDQKEAMLELSKKIQNYCSKQKGPCDKQWQVGDSCAAFCHESKTWRRAVITELHDGEVTLFFTDFAISEKVTFSKIMELPPHLIKMNDAAIKCHMSGVVPAIGGDWPSLTKEYLKELVEGYQRFFITKNGIIKDKSLPIELWVYHKIAGGALEPNRAEWRCLNHKIIEQGLGIPDKSDKSNDDDQQSNDLLNMVGSINEWLALEPSTSGKYVESNIEDKLTSDWLPAVHLETVEFTAIPTYIDNYAVIYLHNVVQEKTLTDIQNMLEKINNTESTMLHTEWLVGEPCLAKFYLDNQLYRSRVVDVYPDDNKCLIHYVDYGNEEICSFEDIRTVDELCEEIFNIPIQSYRCKLAHIKPPLEQRWGKDTLDHIHGLIVDKTCLVRVIGNNVDDLLPIEVKMKDLWLHQYLLDTQQAVFDRSDTLNIPSLQQKSDSSESLSDPDYIVDKSDTESLKTIESVPNSMDITKDWVTMMDESLEEAKNCDEPEEGTFYMFEKNTVQKDTFTCTILVITNFDTFDLIPKLDTELQHLYQDVSEKMQLKGDDMPQVNGVFENKACIARFPQDKVWYRASILEYSKALEKVKVKYVDYGNIEIVPLSQVREIDPEWINPPPVTIQAKIYGYIRNNEFSDDTFSKEYVNTFLDKTLQVNVIEKDDSELLVELRDVTDNKLVYQPLIDNKMFVEFEK